MSQNSLNIDNEMNVIVKSRTRRGKGAAASPEAVQARPLRGTLVMLVSL